MKAVQVIVTAAGSPRDSFLEAGFKKPKNLVKYGEDTILSYVVSHYHKPNYLISVVLHGEEALEYRTEELFARWDQPPRIVSLKNWTSGAMLTALLGINFSLENTPLLIAPGDSVLTHGIHPAVESFISSGVDAGTIVFRSKDPSFSYVRIGEDGFVSEIAEKRVISEYATTGLFYFRDIETFLSGARWALINATNFNGLFYVSHSFHHLLANGRKILAYKAQLDTDYFTFRNPAELAERLERGE